MDIEDNDQNNVISLENEKSKRTITVPDESAQLLPFTAIPNEIIDDSNIIPRAKLLMVYLLKHAGIPGWQYHDLAMQNFLGCGRDNLEAAFKSLRKAGYITNIVLFNEKGKICGSKRIFARTPKFLDLNKSKLRLVPKSSDLIQNTDQLKSTDPKNTRCPEIQGTVNKGTINQGILKRQKLKNKNIKNNNNREVVSNKNKSEIWPEGSVVVALMEKLKHLAISSVLVTSWLRKHSAEYIIEKIDLTESQKPHSPERFLNRAIAQDWKLALPQQSENRPENSNEPSYPSHEENVAWYNSLVNEDKLKHLQMASFKYPMFEVHLKHQQTSVLEASFSSHSLFKMFMSLIGRAKD